MSEGGLTPEDFAQENIQAELDGLEVWHADPRTLLMDLDTHEPIEQFRRLLPKATELFGARVVEEYESRSGTGHLHVIIDLIDPQPAAFRIALQAALGSDPIRELLSLRRLANGIEEPSRLFRKRDAI
jgi:hypothetical protein